MKIKGINIFELHVEKMVLGATLVVAGLLTARQFLTNPNAVNFGGNEYRPAAVDPAIQERVAALDRQLTSNRKLEYSTGESLAGYFKREQQRDLGAGTTLAHAIVRPTPLKIGDESVLGGTVNIYASFTPPAPSSLRVLSRPYTLSDEILADYPELKPILPETPPFDVPVVHIFADVDGTALREMLLQPAEGHNAIPSAWWDGDMTILDIIVERERQLPDGSWGDRQVVPTIPGQKTVREEIDQLTPLEQNEFLNRVFTEYQKELYQPSFYVLQDDEAWTVDLVRALQPLSPEAEEAVGKMQYGWREVGKLRRRLEAMTNRIPSGRGTDAGGKGGGGGGDEGAGGPSGRAGREELQKANLARRIERLKKELEASERNYEDLKDAVRTLVPTYDLFPDEEEERARIANEEKNRQRQERENANNPGTGTEFEGGGEGVGGEGGRGGEYGKGAALGGGPGSRYTGRGRSNRNLRTDEVPFLDNDSLEVWAHDLSVAGGEIYRYRMRINYPNPFFGRENRLSDEQKALGKVACASSATTEWSDPMRMVDTKQFYVTKGTYEESVEARRAAIEVFVYTGGSERMLSMSIRPGEPIGEIRQELIKSDPDSGNDADNEDDPGTARDPEDAPAAEKIAIDYTTGAVFLDVVEVEIGDTSRDRKVQVLVALEDGSIIALDPEEQKASEDRSWLKELVKKDAK